MTAPLPRVLVIEPHFVLRRTIVLTAARLGIAEVQEAPSLETAERMLAIRAHDTIVLALDAAPSVQLEQFLAQCHDMQVIGVAPCTRNEEIARWQQHGVHHVLQKPARVRELLGLISMAKAPKQLA